MEQKVGKFKFWKYCQNKMKEAVRDLPKITVPLNSVCRHCQHGKQTRASFKTKECMTSHPPKIVHTDLCGTTRTKSMQ